MRLLAYLFVSTAVSIPLLTGCSSSNPSQAQDDAFQQQLAKAAAENKNASTAKKGPRGALPPEAAALMGKGSPPTPPSK